MKINTAQNCRKKVLKPSFSSKYLLWVFTKYWTFRHNRFTTDQTYSANFRSNFRSNLHLLCTCSLLRSAVTAKHSNAGLVAYAQYGGRAERKRVHEVWLAVWNECIMWFLRIKAQNVYGSCYIRRVVSYSSNSSSRHPRRRVVVTGLGRTTIIGCDVVTES